MFSLCLTPNLFGSFSKHNIALTLISQHFLTSLGLGKLNCFVFFWGQSVSNVIGSGVLYVENFLTQWGNSEDLEDFPKFKSEIHFIFLFVCMGAQIIFVRGLEVRIKYWRTTEKDNETGCPLQGQILPLPKSPPLKGDVRNFLYSAVLRQFPLPFLWNSIRSSSRPSNYRLSLMSLFSGYFLEEKWAPETLISGFKT